MDEFMIFRLGYLEYTSCFASFDSPETSKERVQEWSRSLYGKPK